MGNQHSNERPKTGRGGGLLTSAEEIEEWLPDSVKRLEKGSLPAHRDVDWTDETVVEKATQLNTIHNVVEERKTLKRTNSFSGKLANLSIGKKRGERKKTGLARSVSFSSLEREELTFDAGCSCEAFSPEEHGYHAAMQLVKDNGGQFQFSPTSVCVDDHSHRPY